MCRAMSFRVAGAPAGGKQGCGVTISQAVTVSGTTAYTDSSVNVVQSVD